MVLNYNPSGTYHFSRAKLLLRKKKFQEGLLERTDGQLDNLERLMHDLEFAQVERQVIMHSYHRYLESFLLMNPFVFPVNISKTSILSKLSSFCSGPGWTQVRQCCAQEGQRNVFDRGDREHHG